MLAYLVGAKDVRVPGTDSASPPLRVSCTRYGFTLDGPAFAGYQRDQLEQNLIQKGELPPGLTLDASRIYRDVKGQGEIWIDRDGLPLRLVVHLSYPDQSNGERVEAHIKSDFSNFDCRMLVATLSLLDRLGQNVSGGLRSAAGGTMPARAALVAACLGFILLVVAFRRSKWVYTGLVVFLISSMVFTPLLQVRQAAAFYEKQAARQAAVEKARADQAAARELRAEATGANWDPHRNPVAGLAGREGVAAPARLSVPAVPAAPLAPAADEEAVDTDNDGVTDDDEVELGTNPADADSADDGLTDGVEVIRMGTSPTREDSDDGGIWDGVELLGFSLSGQKWYLNPNNPDTNGDGLADGHECPALTGVVSAPDTVSCGNDGDGNFDEPDGYIDTFQSVHAGVDNEACSGTCDWAIWSHSWYAYYNLIGIDGPAFNKLGGIRIGNSDYWVGKYTIQPENGGVGVFTHRYGHDLVALAGAVAKATTGAAWDAPIVAGVTSFARGPTGCFSVFCGGSRCTQFPTRERQSLGDGQRLGSKGRGVGVDWVMEKM